MRARAFRQCRRVLAMERGRGADRDRLREDCHMRGAGRRHLGAEDHARTQHAPPPEAFAQRFDIAESVLHRDDQAVAGQSISQRIRDRFSVVTLDRTEDQIEAAGKARLIVGELHAVDGAIAEQSRNLETVARDRVHVRATAEERDVVAGVMQHPAEYRADCAGARDQDWSIGHRVEVIGRRIVRQRMRSALAGGQSRGLGSRDGTDIDSVGRHRDWIVGDERVGRALGGTRRDL